MSIREGAAAAPDSADEKPTPRMEELLSQFQGFPEDEQLRFLKLAFDAMGEPASAPSSRRRLTKLIEGTDWGPPLGPFPPVH